MKDIVPRVRKCGNYLAGNRLFPLTGTALDRMPTTSVNQRRLQGSDFGALLKHWRERKALSQLSLALACDVSQRHVSFLESGRAMPSREMILRLATQLDVPLRYRNELLLAAGFAPLYSESDWDSPDITPVRQAVDLILARQEPYPAIVLDCLWNIKLANAGAIALFNFLSSNLPVSNLLLATFDSRILRPAIENWDALAAYLRQRIRQEMEVHGASKPFQQLFEEVKQLDIPKPVAPVSVPRFCDPVIWISLRKGAFSARLFSTITTLGTAHDVTLQELRIECFFPADEESSKQLRSLPRV